MSMQFHDIVASTGGAEKVPEVSAAAGNGGACVCV